MSSSLLLQQCPVCLVCLTWIVFVMGGRLPDSCCFVGYMYIYVVHSIRFQIFFVQAFKVVVDS